MRLHAALARAGQQAGAPARMATAAFRPHLSIAYHNARRPAAPLISAAAELRSLPAVDLSVSEVQLVKLRREGQRYVWETVRSFPLPVTQSR